jgi:16S rRNA (cytosine967-C5)-methyltransferase
MFQESRKLNEENTSASTGSETLYKGARGAAVKVLTRVEQSDAYLDKVLNRELSSPDLNELDRRLLNELATGVLRWQAKLDWILTGFYHGEFPKCIPIVKNAMRVALYQILFLDKIPHAAAVNESVELVKRLKGDRSGNLVNAVLRSIIRKINAITFPERDKDVSRYFAIVLSHPLWMVRRWLTQFSEEETEQLLLANNTRPPLSLRVNPMRGSAEELLSQLVAAGIRAQRSQLHPWMLRVEGMANIGGNAAFQAGKFTIQDEGAALAVRLTDVRPGMRAIDLCAAPGGKSTAMAEMMNGEGEIISVDKYDAKLRLIEQTAQRTGFEGIIHPALGDARTIHLEPADVVLVDAPCSGLGVLAKKPDIKWKRRQEDIEPLAELQRAILDHAATLVRPGGHLVYSTCTIEPMENEEVVQSFLKTHPEFELVPASEILPDNVVTPDGFLQTYPHRHGVDGTFGARMRRKE